MGYGVWIQGTGVLHLVLCVLPPIHFDSIQFTDTFLCEGLDAARRRSHNRARRRAVHINMNKQSFSALYGVYLYSYETVEREHDISPRTLLSKATHGETLTHSHTLLCIRSVPMTSKRSSLCKEHTSRVVCLVLNLTLPYHTSLHGHTLIHSPIAT